MKKDRSRLAVIWIVLSALTPLVLLGAFLFGSSGLSLPDLLGLLNGTAKKSVEVIFFSLRLPRALLCFVSGGALAVCGGVLQGMFRNPMADSYVIGVSSGAALGATAAMVFSAELAFLGFMSVQVCAFLGAAAAVYTVYRLSSVRGRISLFTFLLSGIAVSTLASALVYCLMFLFRDQMVHIVMWTMGSFSSASWEKAILTIPPVLLGVVICLFYSRDLNILLQGDETARHLGVDPYRARRILIPLTSMIAALVVSVSGIIGFVGLIVPHILRLIIGPDHRKLLPLSFLAGGIFLLLCDTLARTLVSGQEIPIGVITAILGVPFFLYLLRRGRKSAG